MLHMAQPVLVQLHNLPEGATSVDFNDSSFNKGRFLWTGSSRITRVKYRNSDDGNGETERAYAIATNKIKWLDGEKEENSGKKNALFRIRVFF